MRVCWSGVVKPFPRYCTINGFEICLTSFQASVRHLGLVCTSLLRTVGSASSVIGMFAGKIPESQSCHCWTLENLCKGPGLVQKKN